MNQPRRAICMLIAMVAAGLASGASAAQTGEDRKPSLAFRATPPVGFSPLRVRVSVEVRGGADDYADFYCPSIEWDWGDGTVSESSEDCDPYEAGKSAIKRRFSAEHVFRSSGAYQVYFRLKQRDKTIATANGNVQVRAGVRDEFER